MRDVIDVLNSRDIKKLTFVIFLSFVMTISSRGTDGEEQQHHHHLTDSVYCSSITCEELRGPMLLRGVDL